MQSFQDFLQNRRNKSAESGELQALEHSRPERANPLENSGSGLQHSQSKACPVDLEKSSSERSAAAAAAAAAGATVASPAAAAALTAHTTTTVSGATAPGSRYLSRSSTAAGSKHKLSDGVSAALQQLISPQRSAALMSQSNSFKNNTVAGAAAPGTAGSPSTDFHAAAGAAAAAAAGIAELRTVISSRSAGQVGAGISRLQPLSVADALHSPLSRSTAVTPPALTPTGARTPTGGRRYAAAASAGGVSAGSDAGAAAGSWSVERSATSVLQEAAARAAALHRSTTMKSQASQGDLTGLQGSSSAQRVCQQQHSQQVQQQWPGGQAHQQQQQQPHQQQYGQAALQPPQQHLLLQQQQHEQHQRENAAALLHDLDRRFASIKDSLKGVFSPQDSMQHRFTAGSAAATAASGQAGYGMGRGANDGAKCQHVMTEPYSLDDGSSENSSKVSPRVAPKAQPAGHLSGSPQRQQQQPQQQQQQLLSPTDSSSDDDSSDDEHPGNANWHHHQQQQQQQLHHRTPSPQHASKRGNSVKADVTLCGGIATAGRQQGKPAAIATAAAAAAATTAAAADGSLPIEVDVKCGEEGELQGATAHFIVSHVMSPDASVSKRAQQQQQSHTQHIKQQQLRQELSLPSTYRMLSAEQSDLSIPALSPRGPAHETDSHYSSTNLSAAGAPQPRSNKPKPSIPQRHQQEFQGAAAGKVAPGGAAAAVAAAGRGVLDADADRWCSNALILAKQQAKELQQQNDALVRVLERERQQHTKTRQQVTELKLDLQTAQAEWEVKLQALRQEKLAAEAQLRQALAGGEQQEILAAYDAALAASAARTEEAQAAAARLATQMTELELQVQQLQLICSTTAAAAADGSGAPLPRSRPVSGSSRADNAATLRAVASAECRSPDKRSPCRNGFAPGPAADGCGGRGVRALRQHQTHLEQQVAKLSEELSQLQRENIKLMRYKKQYEVAAQSLQSSGGAKAAAEAFAQEAGLRAAAVAGRADRLEMQVVELQKQVQQLKAEREQLHLQISQQQQRLQASLSAGASSSYNLLSGLEQYSGSDQQPPTTLAGIGGSAAWGAAYGGSGAAEFAGTSSAAGAHEYMPRSLSDGAAAADLLQGQVGSQPSMQGQQLSGPLTGSAVRAGSGGLLSGEGTRRSSGSVSRSGSGSAQRAGAQAAISAAEQEAMCVVQQLRACLPDAAPAQGQLAALMNAIQAGVQERQALAAQGKVLLDMLVGSN